MSMKQVSTTETIILMDTAQLGNACLPSNQANGRSRIRSDCCTGARKGVCTHDVCRRL